MKYEIAPQALNLARLQFRHFRKNLEPTDRTGDPFLTEVYPLSYIGTGAVDEARTRNLRDGNAMLYN